MRDVTFIFSLLVAVWPLLQSPATGVLAAAVCNGAVCSGKVNTIEVNGVMYCCPATDVTPSATNYANPATYSCATTQNCGKCT